MELARNSDSQDSTRAKRRLVALQKQLIAGNPTAASSAAAAARTMAYKSPITSHVLDTSRGKPAANMRIELHKLDGANKWQVIHSDVTNDDGRVGQLVPQAYAFTAGTYRVVFFTQEYFDALQVTEFFYPEVTITFRVHSADEHYHVPLLINPFGYSTYRGS